MVTARQYYRSEKLARAAAKRSNAEMTDFSPLGDNGGGVATLIFKDADIRIKGRNFKVEKLDGRSSWIAYRLVGPRGSAFLACRNARHPEQLFIVPERITTANPFDGTWLKEVDGKLEVL